MLELQCTCGWNTRGETKDELLVRVTAHVPNCADMRGDPAPDEGMLRALIAQRARAVGD
jgi:hypothetical protein